MNMLTDIYVYINSYGTIFKSEKYSSLPRYAWTAIYYSFLITHTRYNTVLPEKIGSLFRLLAKAEKKT